MSEIAELQASVRTFADRRAWGRFHTPKNLAMALTGEAGELLSEFQWLTETEAQEAAIDGALKDRVSADPAIYDR